MSQPSHNDDLPIQPWEQRAQEPDRAFGAFRIWLFTPKPRPGSCRSVATLFKTLAEAKKLPKDIGEVPTYKTFNRWMTEFDWIARARRYDAHLLGAEVEARVDARVDAAYDDELGQYRDRLLKAGRTIEGFGITLFVKGKAWLDTLPSGDPIPPGLSQLARAAETLVTKGFDIQGSVFGLDDIIGTLARGRPSGDE